MDKQEALDAFKDPDGPQILLASEVASEGIDLQFCNILINYDLPWNPAKLEQRIGRIDRIGQDSPFILVLNLVYKNTVDDRIYTRLLDRVKQSSRILGSMEQVLGEEIQKLSYELLTNKLTPEQEAQRIEQTSLALANLEQQEETLELAATHLMAHGDFIQNKVKAAKEQGRYIKGVDLYDYVKDFFGQNYEGSQIVKTAQNEDGADLFKLQFSVTGKQEFNEFLSIKSLLGKTALTRIDPPLVLFQNTVGNPLNGIERITQEHPLIQFISEKLKQANGEKLYHLTSAVELDKELTNVAPGQYVYFVMRWSFSGSKLVERLEYMLINLATQTILDGDEAEQVINSAATNGRDWLGANNLCDCALAADLQDKCMEKLEELFEQEKMIFKREDNDRSRMQIQQLDFYYQEKIQQENQIIERIKSSNNPRAQQILRARAGQKKNEKLKITVDEKKQVIMSKSKTNFDYEEVSSGLINIV